MSDLATIYRRAAQVIDERGWHQGWYTDSDGQKVCLLGACAVAAGATFELGDREPPVRFGDSSDGYRLWHAAWDDLMAKRRSLASWNDAPERTAEEVKAFLLAAAEDAER